MAPVVDEDQFQGLLDLGCADVRRHDGLEFSAKGGRELAVPVEGNHDRILQREFSLAHNRHASCTWAHRARR